MESVKRDREGNEVTLTDAYKKLIAKLRTDAPSVLAALESIRDMLDPNATQANPPPPIRKPIIWRDRVNSLITALTTIITRNWDTTTWEDDDDLLTRPFGNDWEVGLWDALHDFQIDFGLEVGGYEAVYTWGIFFARNQSTWPAQGADPRPAVEDVRTIANYTSELVDLEREVGRVEEGRKGGVEKALGWLGILMGNAPRGSGRGGNKGAGGAKGGRR